MVRCSCKTERVAADVLMFLATMGVLGTFNGLYIGFRSWNKLEFGVYQPVIGVAIGVFVLICAAWSFRIAYVGTVPIKKGTRGENGTVGNNDSQPKSGEVALVGR